MLQTENGTALIGAFAVLCLLVLLFFFFAPVKLEATYPGVIHQYEVIDDAGITATARTFSGQEYRITKLRKSSEAAGGEAGTVTIGWGLLKAAIALDPIELSRYTVEYSETCYRNGELEQPLLTVSAHFADGAVRVLGGEEYAYQKLDGKRNTTVTVSCAWMGIH